MNCRCPRCGADELKEEEIGTENGHPVYEIYCRECGLIFCEVCYGETRD